MKMAITGPRGNLGSHITPKINSNIITIDRNDWSNLKEKLDGVDTVIHTAYDLKTDSRKNPTQLIESNLTSTTKLLQAMKSYKIPRIMFISSCAVYGTNMITEEELPCTPISINGTTKYLNEQLIETFCKANDIKYEIYRIFNMFGGSDEFSIISHLKRSIESHSPFIMNNNGLSQRDFIHVEDVANILVKLLDNNHKFTHLNIGSGNSIKIKELVDIVKVKHPKLCLKNSTIPEAEYSRANIDKLLSLMDYKFVDIRDYLKKNL